MAAGCGEGVGLDQVLGQVTALVVSLLTHVTRVPVTKPVLSPVHPECTLYTRTSAHCLSGQTGDAASA